VVEHQVVVLPVAQLQVVVLPVLRPQQQLQVLRAVNPQVVALPVAVLQVVPHWAKIRQSLPVERALFNLRCWLRWNA
jgi:hypothetical protein